MKLRRVAEKNRKKKKIRPVNLQGYTFVAFLFLRRTQELGLHFLICVDCIGRYIYFTKKRLNVKIYRGKVDEH